MCIGIRYRTSRLLSTETSSGTKFSTADHVGSPRINTDGSGNVTARHDYMPFGEEISTTQRTSGVGYAGDGVRKQFTGYEKDGETGLEFAEARMYSNTLGRYSSVDPTMASADIIDPRTFNRYAYVGNNPVNITDPTGELWGSLNGSIYWYDTQKQMDDAGAKVAYVGVIAGTSQLVALNPTSMTPVAVSSAQAAIETLASWEIPASGIAAAGAALNMAPGVAITLAMAYVETYLPENFPIDNRPEQVSGYSMSKKQEEYFESLADQMGKLKQGEANPSTSAESTPADPNAGKPNPEENKPSTGSSKPPGHDKDWVKLRGNQGYRDPDGNIWKKDMLHKDHWDVSDRKGNKIREVDFNGKQIWPDGPKNKNK